MVATVARVKTQLTVKIPALLLLATPGHYDGFMNMESKRTEELEAATAALGETAAQLGQVLAELAGRLRPFPPFLGMVSVQAVELEPPVTLSRDLGCVVVDPQGRICQLDLREIAGIAGFNETDQVEEFQELELSDAEFIIYAATAIGALAAELGRRSR